MKDELIGSVKSTVSAGFAIGNDLVFLPDFTQSLTTGFKNKVYTDNELIYCELFNGSVLPFASTWAAKEAVYKAVSQIDPSPLSWKRIEIVRERVAGKPRVIIPGADNYDISLSISHDGDYAWAVAIVKSKL